jgi:hypothetical protein
MKLHHLTALLLLAAPMTTVQAREWHFGAAVAAPSGTGDVQDIYEANYKALGYTVEMSKLLPIGLAFDAHYQWDSGMRVGIGAGPFVLIASNTDDVIDVSHFELPINGTVGYTFIPGGNVSPYIKVGLVAHSVSGDFIEASNPGLLAAAGIEFSRKGIVNFALEIATDQSEVEFEKLCGRNQPSCRPSTVTLNTYDVIVSFIVKFGRSRTQ